MAITISHKAFQKVIFPGLGNVQMPAEEVEVEVTYTPIGIGQSDIDGTMLVFFETSVPGCNLPGSLEFSFKYQGIDTVYNEAEQALKESLVPIDQGS